MLILVGIFDLGRAFNAYIVITNAAREGAYYGSLYPLDTDGIVTQVTNEAQGSGISLTADDIAISTTYANGTPMSVSVTHDFSLITGYVFGGQPITLQSRAEMMIVMEF
jgi:Flp pilus assembly protein TadG